MNINEHILAITIAMSIDECRDLAPDEFRRLLNYRLNEARKKIEHEVGLDDGTFELSQELQ